LVGMLLHVLIVFFHLILSARSRLPPRSTLFPTRRSSDLGPLRRARRRGPRPARHRADALDRHLRLRLARGDRPDLLPQGLLPPADRKSTRLNSSHRTISYAVFCLKKKNIPRLSYSSVKFA